MYLTTQISWLYRSSCLNFTLENGTVYYCCSFLNNSILYRNSNTWIQKVITVWFIVLNHHNILVKWKQSKNFHYDLFCYHILRFLLHLLASPRGCEAWRVHIMLTVELVSMLKYILKHRNIKILLYKCIDMHSLERIFNKFKNIIFKQIYYVEWIRRKRFHF